MIEKVFAHFLFMYSANRYKLLFRYPQPQSPENTSSESKACTWTRRSAAEPSQMRRTFHSPIDSWPSSFKRTSLSTCKDRLVSSHHHHHLPAIIPRKWGWQNIYSSSISLWRPSSQSSLLSYIFGDWDCNCKILYFCLLVSTIGVDIGRIFGNETKSTLLENFTII